RADGAGWLPTARALGLDPADLKRLCAGAGAGYYRLFRRARRAVVRQTLAESLHVLRGQMRHPGDPAAARRSAEAASRVALALGRDRLARKRLKLQFAPKADPTAALAGARTAEDLLALVPDTAAGRAVRERYASGV